MSKLPDGWKIKNLDSIGEVKFSNVDKKIYKDQVAVRLCNYMDVYKNEYIDSRIKFMPSTATIQEIENFRLNKFDVIFTKDSETPDDIANSSVVVEDIENLVCGYHLARIRSNPIIAYGPFLSKQLKSDFVRHQFIIEAKGSTRFGLGLNSISKIQIPLPPLDEQKKIAEILSSVDCSIDSTEKLISKLSDLKKALMQELFTKGIGHTKFKDSPLGRIPEAWDVEKLGNVANVQGGFAFKSTDDSESGIRWFKIANTGIGKAKWDDISYLPSDFTKKYPTFLLKSGDVVIAMTRPVLSRKLKIAKLSEDDVPALLNQRVGRLFTQSDKLSLNYAFYYLQQQSTADNIERIIFGTDPPNISSKEIESLCILKPAIQEQIEIAGILSGNDAKIEKARLRLAKLKDLKKGLMQDLLTGKVRVK